MQQCFCRSLNCSPLLTVGILSLMVFSAQGDDYLKESPSFLKPCKFHDSLNGECISKAFENIFTNWRQGVPGLNSIGSIDPFSVKKIHLEQNNPNLNIKVDLTNMIVSGLSHATIDKSSVNNEYTFKFLLKVPKLNFKSGYHIKGSILFLRLDGTGPLQIDISDGEFILTIKANLINNFNQQFFDITDVQSHIKNIGNFNIQFDNLFSGNIELENSANAVFNENWRELFEILRPAIEETLDVISKTRYRKILSYIPATYFFVDLP